MGRVFNQQIFSFRIFRTFDARQARAQKTKEMHEWIRKHGKYPSRHELEEAGFKDCLGEVESYNEENSGWSSRSFKVEERKWAENEEHEESRRFREESE